MSIKTLASALDQSTKIIIFWMDKDGGIISDSEMTAEEAKGEDFEVSNITAEEYGVISCDACR